MSKKCDCTFCILLREEAHSHRYAFHITTLEPLYLLKEYRGCLSETGGYLKYWLIDVSNTNAKCSTLKTRAWKPAKSGLEVPVHKLLIFVFSVVIARSSASNSTIHQCVAGSLRVKRLYEASHNCGRYFEWSTWLHWLLSSSSIVNVACCQGQRQALCFVAFLLGSACCRLC